METAQLVTITLNTLACNREERFFGLGSNPYLWPAMVFVNKDNARVDLVSIQESSAHKILKTGMRAGDVVAIDPRVGTMRRHSQEPVERVAIILTVAMFEDNETPDDAVKAGFRAFRSTLETSIEGHLGALISDDPAVVDEAQEEIAQEVEDAVFAATKGALSTSEKLQVKLGLLTPDAELGSGSTSFEEVGNRAFSLTIGDSLGGRLLRYVDGSQVDGAEVSSPQVIGQGGWQQFLHLFPGEGNVIYAVDTDGRLLRYADASQTGGGDVSSPQVVGQGGWQQFLHLFPGAGNVIYAVDTDGKLLRYVDASQTGGGDVSSPQVIGQGGWQQFQHLFPGEGNVIYAVDADGKLLRYVDASQTGGGDVSSPQVVGQGGWRQFLHLFPGEGNVIYAVDQDGKLLRYVDASQTGGGDVSSPQTIGQGGWQQFGFLFGGEGNVIYAAEKALTPDRNYAIEGTLDVKLEPCFAEQLAVNQAKVALEGAKEQLRNLRTQFGQASPAERPAIQLDIDELEQQMAALQEQLAAAQQTLQACLSSHDPVLEGVIRDPIVIG